MHAIVLVHKMQRMALSSNQLLPQKPVQAGAKPVLANENCSITEQDAMAPAGEGITLKDVNLKNYSCKIYLPGTV